MGQLSVFILLSVLCGLIDCFWRRRYHSSVLAGNWIYIDGGDIMNQQGRYLRNNDTYGLDLSKNWTNSSLVLTSTERPADAMPLSGQALWFDEKRNLIYCFGGFTTSALYSYDPTPFESIWAFTPDEKGTGSWKEVLGPTGTDTFPLGIRRPYHGGFCSDESYGYHVGGFASSRSTRLLDNESAIVSRGLLKFDFGALKITNTSDGDYGRSESVDHGTGSGKVVNVPIYGAGGIVILLGEGNPTHVISFNNITIYDKTEQNWYSQLAFGDLPEPRSDFCIVGIQGTTESGNFEIFMYGGVINYELGSNAANSDQVYILSLPAFQWFKAIYPPAFSRALHTCHTTNTNQMIIVGGVDPSNDTLWTGWADNGYEPVDPWPEGIGIFDMTALKFKDIYEANAKQYETPEPIKLFYNDTSKRYPATWNSPAVQELFQTKSNQTSNATASNSSIAKPTNPQRSPSHLSSASIAGIAIGVAIAVLTLFAIAILTVRRRTKKANLKPGILRGELPADERRHELPASAKIPELANEHDYRTELANTGIIELFDTSRQDHVANGPVPYTQQTVDMGRV